MTKISLIQKKCFMRQSNKTSLSQHMQFAIVRITSVRSPYAASVSARPSQIPQSVPAGNDTNNKGQGPLKTIIA